MKGVRFIKRVALVVFMAFNILSVSAQVDVVGVDVRGDILVRVVGKHSDYIVIDAYGEVVDISSRETKIKHYPDFFNYNACKISHFGDTTIDYHSDMFGYEAGKIKKIGNITFKYHSDFWDYEAGKIARIGNVKIEYYSWSDDRGKVKSIGSERFTYSFMKNAYEGLSSGNLYFEQNGIEFEIMPSKIDPRMRNRFNHRR
ncbi:MAG: hypothetical protein SNH55_08650 [Rikenellaceae bacterium]